MPNRSLLSLRGMVALLTTSLATLVAPPVAVGLTVQLVLDELDGPVRLVAAPGDPRLFVVEQPGTLRVFTAHGAPLGVFLDLTALTDENGERGLLGLAFAPDYATSGRFYVNYTDLAGDTQVVRYLVSVADPDRADPDSDTPVIAIDQPYSNHNGGHLEFGPDGMLYIGTGDGGSGGDPQNNAQNDQSLLGKMLRLDVSTAAGYQIPGDNPFVGLPPRDEIWAKGLRNPWCYGFDRLTGDLWIADVGQSELEEIDVQPAASAGGENYGWRLMEGSACYDPPANCNDGSLVLPIHEYTHGGTPFRCSISGGYVYRGAAVAELEGRYVFADYCSRQIWALAWTPDLGAGEVVELTAQLTPPGGYGSIVSIGQDAAGELYVVDKDHDRIYRIVSDTTGLGELPPAVRLEQNAPNPFNPGTTIAYVVPAGGATLRLEVLDVEGRLVRTLVAGPRPAGRQLAYWDGAGDDGRAAPAGVYLYRLRAGGLDEPRKMALLK